MLPRYVPAAVNPGFSSSPGRTLTPAHLHLWPFDRAAQECHCLVAAAELAPPPHTPPHPFSFHCPSPAMIFTLTGSPLLLSALWNPEAVKQIVKRRVSTFRQRSNPGLPPPLHTTRLLMGVTPPAGWNINQDNPTKTLRTL